MSWPSWPRHTTCPRTSAVSPHAASGSAPWTMPCPGTRTPRCRSARACCAGRTTPSGRRPRRTRRGRRPRRRSSRRSVPTPPGPRRRSWRPRRGVASRDRAAHRGGRARAASWSAGSGRSTSGSRGCCAHRRRGGGRAERRAAADGAGARAGRRRGGAGRAGHRAGLLPSGLGEPIVGPGEGPTTAAGCRCLRPRARVRSRCAGSRAGARARPPPRRAGPAAAPGTEAALSRPGRTPSADPRATASRG